MSKKLTVVDILKEKEKYQKNDNVTEELYIPRLDATVVISKPTKALCLEAIDMTTDSNLVDKADPFLVYNVMVEPNLKDPALRKEFECVEPYDIVDKLFEAGEVVQIAKFALSLNGYDSSVKRVKDIKN